MPTNDYLVTYRSEKFERVREDKKAILRYFFLLTILFYKVLRNTLANACWAKQTPPNSKILINLLQIYSNHSCCYSFPIKNYILSRTYMPHVNIFGDFHKGKKSNDFLS